MSNHSSAILRLLIATSLLSVAALGVGLYGLLRAQAPAPATAPDELAAVRKELGELRHSLEVTRNQQSAPGSANAIADAERRIARLESQARTQPAGTVAAPAEEAAPAAAVTASEIREKVAVERSTTGVATFSGSDPGLVNAAMQRP